MVPILRQCPVSLVFPFSVHKISDRTKNNQSPANRGDEELQFIGSDKSKSKRLSKQREMLKRLINMDAVRNMEYDDNQIPTDLEYLDLLCSCGHGERTIGMCAHRGALLKGLKYLFNNESPPIAHPQSTFMSTLQTNNEADTSSEVSEDEFDPTE